ncbi:MAG: tRNA (guanine(10)-N(2))-dimethyltransferase, partial [Nanoarchaeota archaeon]
MQLKQTTEGKAKILVYSAEKISSELPVFYNPVMKFNRDVSVALLKALGRKDLIIADIMAGSGVRSIRFFKELPKRMIKELHVNDSSADAVKLIKKNFKLNKIKSKNVFFANKEANKLLLEIGKADYIDIDPFGSPNYFLDSACKKLADKGILAVTATDTSALSGTYPEACLRKYWAKP